MNKRKLGQEKENFVCRYLEERGVTILEQNFRVRQGEIDIIGMDQGCYVFIEVKYRSKIGQGVGLEAVDVRKQKQISKVALFYIGKHQISLTHPMRFDVVSIDQQQITWIKNAFEYLGPQ